MKIFEGILNIYQLYKCFLNVKIGTGKHYLWGISDSCMMTLKLIT